MCSSWLLYDTCIDTRAHWTNQLIKQTLEQPFAVSELRFCITNICMRVQHSCGILFDVLRGLFFFIVSAYVLYLCSYQLTQTPANSKTDPTKRTHATVHGWCTFGAVGTETAPLPKCNLKAGCTAHGANCTVTAPTRYRFTMLLPNRCSFGAACTDGGANCT